MKTKITTLILILTSSLSYGQWSGTGDIYYNNGNVGIGTNSPSYNFHLIGSSYLQGDTKINGALLFNKGVSAPITNSTHPAIYESTNSGLPYPFNEAGNLILQPESTYNKDIVFMAGNPTPEISAVIKHNGRVGIGTTNPTESNLHVYRNTTTLGWGNIDQTQAVLKVEDSSTKLFIDGNSIYTNASMNLGTIGASRITFGTNNKERVRITSAGKLGIGTEEPQEKLSISGGNLLVDPEYRVFTDYIQGERGSLNLANDDWVVGATSIMSRGRVSIALDDNNNDENAQFVIGKDDIDPSGTNWEELFSIKNNGNIGIGMKGEALTSKLEVNGNIRAKEIKVEASPWPDYVFAGDYELSSLEETASYIEENHHLPEMPSAKEVEANGVNLGEMNMLLLKKIEELTLHLIEMKAKNVELENRMSNLELSKK